MGKRISEDTVVRDLVVKHPATREILEKLGIDYCCGGKHTLKEAAVEKGMDLKKVLDGLNVVLTQTAARRADHRDWEAASLGELMDHILSRHHTFTKEQMPRLDALLAKVTKAHAANHGKMLRALQGVFGPFKAEIDGHLMKEERVLFPSIRRKEGKADMILDGPIRQMELDHENAGRALAAMRELTSGYRLPPDACPSFVALFEGIPLLETDLHEHIHLENNILFPRALETRGNACSVRKGQK